MSSVERSPELELGPVPLRPIGKREIQALEAALIVGTLLRPEVLELVRDPAERSTWLDSLAAAAAALARSKAGMTIGQIAEELGRSEASIRSHLGGKTKAGALVQQTYELLRRGELRLDLPALGAQRAELEELRREKAELERRASECAERLRALEGALRSIEERLRALEELRSIVSSALGASR